MPKRLLSCLFAFAIAAHADVQFDVTTDSGTLQRMTAEYRVEWIPIPIYDISPDLYTASVKSVHLEASHFQIKGNKLAVAGPQLRQVIDLDAKTITTINTRKKLYSVQSLELRYPAESKLLFKHWAHSTGETKTLEGETATRYDVVSAETEHGRPRVFMSMVCWVVNRSPSAELGRFRGKWAATTSLPFPDSLSGVSDGAFGALAEVVKNLNSQIVNLTMATRSFAIPIDGREDSFDRGPAERERLRRVDINARQVTLSNITAEPVLDDAFTVPAGFKQSKRPVAPR